MTEENMGDQPPGKGDQPPGVTRDIGDPETPGEKGTGTGDPGGGERGMNQPPSRKDIGDQPPGEMGDQPPGDKGDQPPGS